MTDDVPPSPAGDDLAALQVATAQARNRQHDHAAQEAADAEAGRSITFAHRIGGAEWRVHVAPATARGNLEEEGFAGEPTRADEEAWVERNGDAIRLAAERKVAAGATHEPDVWVHTRDLR